MRLYVNIDHVATVRQARRTDEPDPVRGAVLAELGGAHGITVHLRDDRRHIQDRDVRILMETVRTGVNLELAAGSDILDLACKLRPIQATLVPENRKEVTTEGGLDLGSEENREALALALNRLNGEGVRTSLFVDPDPAGHIHRSVTEFVEARVPGHGVDGAVTVHDAEPDMTVGGAHRTGIHDFHASHGEDRLPVAGAEGLESIEFLRHGFGDVGRRNDRLDMNRRRQLLGFHPASHRGIEQGAELFDAILEESQAGGHRVPAETFEDPRALGKAVDQRNPLDGASRSLPETVVVDPDHDRGQVVRAGQAGGNDPDDAGMPAAAGDDQGRRARGAVLRLDRLGGLVEDDVLDALPLPVHRLQECGRSPGRHRILFQQQAQAGHGVVNPPQRVETRSDPESDMVRTDRGNDIGGFEKGP